jgi:5-methylcytosine-specific restriction endonuclease McrA
MIQRSKPIRRTPLKRSTKPIARSKPKAKRTKPRRGRLKGDDLKMLRLECWERDGGICQKCGARTLIDRPPEHPLAFHMAHKRNKRMWGDSLDQVQAECGDCHRKYHQFGPSMTPPCPPKK